MNPRTSPSSGSARIFLCHSSSDKEDVRKLYQRLLTDGFAPWFDEEDLLPGQDWQMEIPRAVRSSAVVLVCLSRSAVTKAGYVQREIRYALDVAAEQPDGAIFMIPMRLEECEVPDRLRQWQWVNLFEEQGYSRLLKALATKGLVPNTCTDVPETAKRNLVADRTQRTERKPVTVRPQLEQKRRQSADQLRLDQVEEQKLQRNRLAERRIRAPQQEDWQAGLTPDQRRGVDLVCEIARARSWNLYLTGSTVRDLIAGFPAHEIELSIHGNPLLLQGDLEKAGISIQGREEDLQVVYLEMPGDVRAELHLARSETYDKPGQAPTIAPATINEDLKHRDFTINAIARSLTPGSWGLLLDPFNGVSDVETGTLRVLHNYAFLENPVRLIRATRLSTRFRWPLEERTQARYDSAKENNYIEFVNKRSVGHELEQLAYEPDPVSVVEALDREGWLKILHPHLALREAESSKLTQMMKLRDQMNKLHYAVDTGPITMYFLTRHLSETDVAKLQAMIPRRDLVKRWRHLENGAHELEKKLVTKEARTLSGLTKLLSGASPSTILYLRLATKDQILATDLNTLLVDKL